MNYFVGLEMAWLQKRPSDKHLRRLAASLTHDQTGELYRHFELDSQKWKNMEFQYSRRDVVDMHFFALLDWKRNYKTPTRYNTCMSSYPGDRKWTKIEP